MPGFVIYSKEEQFLSFFWPWECTLCNHPRMVHFDQIASISKYQTSKRRKGVRTTDHRKLIGRSDWHLVRSGAGDVDIFLCVFTTQCNLALQLSPLSVISVLGEVLKISNFGIMVLRQHVRYESILTTYCCKATIFFLITESKSLLSV